MFFRSFMYYGKHTIPYIVYSGKSVIISTSQPFVRGRIADTAVQEVFIITGILIWRS